MPGKVASVVLAAGAAIRFGGRKQLALLEGRPLLEHALAVAAASGTDLTVLVLGAYAEEIEAAVDLGDARVVRAPDWELGRAASLRAGLAALPDDVEAALIGLGDEPYVSPATAARLLAGRRPGLAALRASYAGRPGHPVLVERELFARLESPGDRKPGQILKAAGALLVPCDDLGTSVDIDTRAQLEELRAHPPAQVPDQSGRPSRTSE
ncbi:MAG: nucleotidyltransferase family protein [Actinobacteria bacterium]|nr:nucleotidyltransferase family protein [Actinomycetota bacterium]